MGRNFGTIASAQLFTQILTLVVSLVVARSLGVEQYGIFVFGLAFPSWFLLFALLGLDAVLTIDVAADRSKAGSYLTAVALLRIPLVLIATLSLWIFVQLVLSDPFARTVTMILGVSSLLATYAGTFRSVFRAFERMEFGALVTVIERSVTTAGVVILVLLGYGLLEVAWVFLLGSVVNLILLVFITRRRFVWFERQVDLSTAGRILRKAVPFALAAVVGTLLYSSGPVLLTIMQDPIGTGQFNAAFALTLAVHSPLTIYATVALPMLSRVHRDRPEFLPSAIQRAQRLFFIVGMPISLGGWFYANEIMVLFYGEAFQVSARSFEVLIFAVAISTAAVGTG
ncbi:MAG: flippase, partial [Thermoplasmata archaeon]